MNGDEAIEDTGTGADASPVKRLVSKPILLCGDCLEIMRTAPAESIDLTVTSPPYDNLRTYNGNNAHWGEHVWKQVIAELYRVTKQGGVVVWGNCRYPARLLLVGRNQVRDTWKRERPRICDDYEQKVYYLWSSARKYVII